MSSVRSRILLAALCGIFFAGGLLSLNTMILYTPDSARYLSWANSLAALRGFIDLTTPEPARYVIHAPLYPILLAPAAALFPPGVVAAKFITLLFGAALLPFFYRWAHKKVSAAVALAGTAVLACNPLLAIYSTQILSDAPFALCFLFFLLFAEKEAGDPPGSSEFPSALLAVVIVGFFMREVGLTLILAACALLVMRRRFRDVAFVLAGSLSFYLAWYLRNEVIVAGIEHPPMRNSKVFLSHLYTPNQSSLLAEFLQRFISNSTVYGGELLRLVFFPDYTRRSHSLISPADPLVASVLTMLPVLQYIMVVVPVGLVLYGLWVSRRSPAFLRTVTIAVLCYLGPILLYPINDVRFMFPLLLPVLLLACLAADDLLSRFSRRPVAWLMGGLTVVCLVPNVAWLESFVRNSYGFARSPAEFAARIRTEQQYPEQFTKVFAPAGRWIASRSDARAVVMSRWKELAFWLEGRTVLDLEPEATLENFEHDLRDYDIRYIVSLSTRAGLREYEPLMDRSRKFSFNTVYRVGSVEVIEVASNVHAPREPGSAFQPPVPTLSAEERVRSDFREGLVDLESGSPVRAESLMTALATRIGPYGSVIFEIGVAKEFAGDLEGADRTFRAFRSVAQAGSFVQLAWYHQEIIARLTRAESSSLAQERADRFQVVGINYWELGYTRRALAMLDSSLVSLPSYFPSLILRSLFRLRSGDSLGSRQDMQACRRMDSVNVLVRGLAEIFRLSETMKRARSSAERARCRLELAGVYLKIGASEDAIGELLEALREDPDNANALTALVPLYESKERYGPALHWIEKLRSVRPNDPVVDMDYRSLRSRW